MYKKILVPFDDSEPSHNALAHAVTLVEGIDGATITVLNVVEWHDFNAETFKIASHLPKGASEALDEEDVSQITTEATSQEKERVRIAIDDAIANAPNVDIQIVTGSPHDAIVSYASDNDYDCIVMGHRGLGLIRGMLGSVAFSVLTKADKPVLVCK